jgi:Flp pilus assembly protein CpaB
MKRNMVPLLGIAFVAAIIATGVVYGLFGGKLRGKPAELPGQTIVVAARDLDRGTVITAGDLQVSRVNGALKGSYAKVDQAVGATLLEAVQKDEPLLEDRVASLDPKSGGGGRAIAAGMRAVSIRVAESSGLMGLLHSGSRVDLQAVSDRNGSTELRTILQNVEVLRVNPQLEPASGNGHLPVPVATVLIPAQYSDLVALADTGARLRVALRNPLDDATSLRHSLGLATVFTGTSDSDGQNPAKSVPAKSAPAKPTQAKSAQVTREQ